MTDIKEIFFAYEYGHQEIKDSVKRAISEFNHYQKAYHAVSWEELRVGGKIINKTILQKINKAEFFACDLTFINHNVLFELGYAIGKGKKLLIFLNTSTAGAAQRYSSIKFLKNIGYSNYNNHHDILKELKSKSHEQTYLLDEITKLNVGEGNSLDLLYLSPKIGTQASLELAEMLSNSSYKLIMNDATEVEYQTLVWYINSIHKAENIIIHLLSQEKESAHIANAESSFFAGLACGLSKNVLLLAPRPFQAPIDYEDILIQYNSSEECAISCDDWIKERIKLRIATPVRQPEIIDDQIETLLRLGIGNEVAEEEKRELHNYFIEFEAYKKASQKELSIFVGRKGTGKSALFIKLEKDFNLNESNFNIILKPESDELLENLELSILYNSERSKRTFFDSIWKFIFYTRLLDLIYKKIQQKATPYYNKSDLENKIESLYGKEKEILGYNFFGVLKKISEDLKGKSIVEEPKLLETLFARYLSSIIPVVQQYFQTQKYVKINILADNLDSTWEAKNDLNLHAEMILSLLEYSKKFADVEFKKPKEESPVNTILLLRKDIFEFILKKAREPDKLIATHYEINWSKQPNLLRKLVEARFKYKLGLKNVDDIEKVWNQYFNLKEKKHPFDIVADLVVLRPRDIIYFFVKLFEGAIDNDHDKVEQSDLEYAIDAYTNFLHSNLIAEMKAEYPEIDNIVGKIQQEYFNDLIDYNSFYKILINHGYNEGKAKSFIESLFEKQYIIAVNETQDGKMLQNFQELNNAANEKTFWLFKKNKIYILINPQSYYIQNHKRFV